MQIVIPMSGVGERFRRAGYSVPKPLIKIDDKFVIEHVIDMFPGEKNFTFICNQEHLDHAEYHMKKILEECCPTGKIIGISPHKLGPIHAIQQITSELKTDEPVVVNYCDFTCFWDWHDFKKFVEKCECIGAIPGYKGFHPHSLGKTNYAYMKEKNGWVSDIQEKKPFTDNRMEEYASSGTYYFSSARVMANAFHKVKQSGLSVGGEYYVSLAYKPLLTEGKPICIYPLQHFMQWGTPEDVAEYNGWSNAFRRKVETPENREIANGSIVIPMAGLGMRFRRAGYEQTKPQISVSGMPMVRQAVNSLPRAKQHSFVIRGDMVGHDKISQEIKIHYDNTVIETIPETTEGQACTGQIGLEALKASFSDGIEQPITFGACDNSVFFNHKAFTSLTNKKGVDVIVWGARGHAASVRHPKMFSWIDADNDGKIKLISVKSPLSNTKIDPIVIGTFTFNSSEAFERSVKRLFERDERVNGEFYLDSCINDAIELGLNCYLFEVDHFLSWGTPDELKTFEYWQSCFHKWSSHSYDLEKDKSIPKSSVESLKKRFGRTTPTRLEPKNVEKRD